jgi:hypothetical protein
MKDESSNQEARERDAIITVSMECLMLGLPVTDGRSGVLSVSGLRITLLLRAWRAFF